jgi:phosphoribosyl 1,2-cyclic phosphodiesterase/ActR/RegA family two-component response regulator
MPKRILVVDDDPTFARVTATALRAAGHEVRAVADPSLAMGEIAAFKPEVVITDLMMPKVPGQALIAQIRQDRGLDDVKIIVYSGKKFEYDYRSSLEAGADAYLVKPVSNQKLLDTIAELVSDAMKLRFWGTRGSVPRPGKATVRYGGNTSCVSLETTRDRMFIFDAGTGIIDLGRELMAAGKRRKLNLFISHPHWDHIQGLPFFQPLYAQGYEVVIHGASQGRLSLREVIAGQMEAVYFPVAVKEFSSRVYFKELAEGQFEIEGLSVKAVGLHHPGLTLGYLVEGPGGKRVAYITDNELVQNGEDYNRARLVELIAGSDVLIHDANYLDQEYPSRIGWGHSAMSEVLKLAADAKVKTLYLYHHDLHHDDETVAAKEAFGKQYFAERGLDIECISAAEGGTVSL